MRAIPNPLRPALGWLVLGGLSAAVLLSLGACDDTDTPEDCWAGVDTVTVSNMAVTDTVGVRQVFEAYVDSVNTAGGDFWGGDTDWEYVSSRFHMAWQGRRYWEVTHTGVVGDQGRFVRRFLQVDENGVLVAPLGCI